MTGFYLLDNPPRRSQYRKPRREKPSGVIVLHSTESAADVNPPDTGAENVAAFIRNRATAGSYHLLCDSDTIIPLVPLGYEAFHDGTGTNSHSIGISGAFQAHQFASLPQWWRDGCILQMATAAHQVADWVKTNYGISIPPRRLSVAQARARTPGFVTHGMLDPQRRSDPDGTNSGARFPWTPFFAHYSLAGMNLEELPMDDDTLYGLVTLTYRACLGRNPEKLEVFARGAAAIRAGGLGKYVAHIANSPEGEAHAAKLARL